MNRSKHILKIRLRKIFSTLILIIILNFILLLEMLLSKIWTVWTIQT